MTVAVLPQQKHRHTPAYLLSTTSLISRLPKLSSRRPKISQPHSARFPYSLARPISGTHTPTEDAASLSSIPVVHAKSVSAEDLRAIAVALMDALINIPDLDFASSLLAPDVSFHHDSASHPAVVGSRVEFLSFWRELQETHLAGTWECTIREASADVEQRKVWVVGEMKRLDCSDGNDHLLETVEMMTFDERGMICDIQDYQRRVRRESRDED